MMQQKKRPGDVAIRPPVTFKKNVVYEHMGMADRSQCGEIQCLRKTSLLRSIQEEAGRHARSDLRVTGDSYFDSEITSLINIFLYLQF